MGKITILTFLSITLLLACSQKEVKEAESILILELETAANEQLLNKWYPLILDTINGGYFSNVTYDFKLGEKDNKMIVTQARHIWTNATAAKNNPTKEKEYLSYANHGFTFLRDYMWDDVNGGFHNLVTQKGEPISRPGEAKTAYGNSFAIYALATYYSASKNMEALNLAKRTFSWLEEHSHDSIYKGYYQSLELNGTPIVRTNDFPTTSDVGYKDQNSSIHLLEALTSLYEVWPDAILQTRIKELLVLIRDTITSQNNYMNLFFEKDWTPVSFKDMPRDTIQKHYYLDHISFGHDVETAYLMLEASRALDDWQFDETLKKGKKMVDHALKNGWDDERGGFYDGGYYFNQMDSISIVNYDKNWWSQAEGLNSLLLMDSHFPTDSLNYRAYFDQLWDYSKEYLIDPDFGGWYEWGQDVRPETRKDLKGHIWKGAYHDYRALVNCKKIIENNRN
ncbi:MAG: AGE family epimerase/isomerase [Pricia sp.]